MKKIFSDLTASELIELCIQCGLNYRHSNPEVAKRMFEKNTINEPGKNYLRKIGLEIPGPGQDIKPKKSFSVFSPLNKNQMERIQLSAAQKSDITTDKKALAAAQKKGFCDIWTTSKSGLAILQTVLKNPLLKIVIGAVVAAGDAVSESLGCNQQS